MKRTLAYDKAAGQFRTDIAGKRFYLGGDATTAEIRKQQILKYFGNVGEWKGSTFDIAKMMAKGQTIQMRAQPNDADTYMAEEALVRQGVPISPAITMADLRAAETQLLLERIALLEGELKEYAGPRVAHRSTIKFAEVLMEWHTYRTQTAVVPGTQKPTDAVRGEGTIIAFIVRQLEPTNVKLADMDYASIDKLAKKIASRPLAIRSRKPISRDWAREALKILRRVIRWAARTYGYRKPDDWDQAARGEIKVTKADQLRRQQLQTMRYTNDEIRTLFRYAIPSERLVLLLALNCGFRQKETTCLHDDEIQGDIIARFRDKSDIFAVWKLWPETQAALKSTERSTSRKQITKSWKQLKERVLKDDPMFRNIPLKFLCKTGSKNIRRIAGGEVASMYLSHGNHTDDELLEIYADADWQKLHNALETWHEELQLGEISPVTTARTYVPMSSIERCVAMWKQNAPVPEIVKATNLSRASVYRYRPMSQL